MFRLLRIVFIAAVALSAAAPSAGATPTKKLSAELGALWTAVLQTPSAQNSFGTGGQAFGCWSLDGTVAPFGPPPGVSSCTVKPGTRILVAATSFECSTFESNGTTDAELRQCARQGDLIAPSVTVDGEAVQVSAVETALLDIVLPADNIFGQPAGTEGLSVAHAWVALLNPLTPGTHKIAITTDPQQPPFTTTIVVTPGS